MPVNWAFPAAQGEPESFLAILGSIYCCKFVTDATPLAAQSFCNRQSIRCSTCLTNFRTLKNALHSIGPPVVH